MRKEYDNTYFLKDCGGYDSFKKHKGKQLTDERLLTVLYLATPTAICRFWISDAVEGAVLCPGPNRSVRNRY